MLLSFAGNKPVGAAFVESARERDVPLQVIDLDGEQEVHALYGAAHVLVRPDGHVAWRGDDLPDSVDYVIDIVRGAAPQRTNTGPVAAHAIARQAGILP